MRKQQKELEKMLANANPDDGFRVRETVAGDEHALHIGLLADGRPVRDFTEAWKVVAPNAKQYGEKQRVRLLLEALCRFLSTGGTIAELTKHVNDVKQMTNNGNITVWSDEHYLISSIIDTDGNYEHVFAKDGNPFAVRWVEGLFYDVIPLSDIRRDLEAAEPEQS